MTDTTVHLRRAAAATAGLVAVLYVLTGTGWVAVTAEQQPGAIPPLLVGAVLYALLAALLILRPGRGPLIAGALLQVPALLLYLAVATERVPAFEVWGLTIKVLQVVLLAACLGLAVQTRSSAPRRHRVKPVSPRLEPRQRRPPAGPTARNAQRRAERGSARRPIRLPPRQDAGQPGAEDLEAAVMT